MKIKKIVFFLYLASLFVAVNCFSAEAYANTRRSIAIVFDNSDSMVRDSGEKKEKRKYLKRWAQATYALRTFMHMVNEEDVVHLYTVDNGASAADKGVVTKDGINKAISGLGVSYVTKMYGMREAYRWANNQSDTEKWVVILTDGKFYKDKKKGRELSADESIGKYINTYKHNGVKTICVGLGLEGKAKTELKRLKNGKFCHVFFTSKNKKNPLKENKEINEKILEISKEIYTMEKLKDKKIRRESNLTKENAEFQIDENGTLTWETDTEFSKYIQEVIIMAQIEGFVRKKNASHGMEVIYSDRDFTWADKNDIRKFNQNAKKYYNDNNYSYLIDRDLVKKINSSCYIRHYDENDLKRKKIEFKLPKGKSRNDYTYQIYYVLSAEFMPALKAGKTIFTAEDQENFVTEGNYQMDYSVISPDGEKLSKNLLALRKVKGNVKLKINNKNVKSGSSKSFIYKDIKSLAEKEKNQYIISVSYNQNAVNKFYFSVEPDLEKYKLSFWKEEQDINIDRENENKIFLKLTGGKNDVNRIYYWLKRKIKGEKEKKRITYNFKNKDNEDISALGLLLKKAKIQQKEGFIKIGLPVEIVNSDEIKMDEYYQVSISLPGEAEAGLTAENGGIHITQEEPEIVLKQLKTTIIKKAKNDADFDISAYVFDKKIKVEIVDVELTLETGNKARHFSFGFNKKNGNIICKINPNIVKYLVSGLHNDKLSYNILIKRNGKEYLKELKNQEFVSFQWKINCCIWIVILLVIVSLISFFVFLLISIWKGSLLFDELRRKDYDTKTFPIIWLTPQKVELAVNNKIFKKMCTIRLFPCFDQELKNSLEKKKVVLGGKKKGYYLKNFDELDKLSGISVENKLLKETGDSICIRLKNQTVDTDGKRIQQSDRCFQILYKNERETYRAKRWLLGYFIVMIIIIVSLLYWFFS